MPELTASNGDKFERRDGGDSFRFYLLVNIVGFVFYLAAKFYIYRSIDAASPDGPDFGGGLESATSVIWLNTPALIISQVSNWSFRKATAERIADQEHARRLNRLLWGISALWIVVTSAELVAAGIAMVLV